MLLNAGAEKDIASSHADGGCTPLHLACQQGKVATVRLLLECGASVLRTHSGGVTPLHDAARGGHVHVTALLLSVGGASIIDVEDAEGATALHLAAASGELGTVRLLIENGADIGKSSNVRPLSSPALKSRLTRRRAFPERTHARGLRQGRGDALRAAQRGECSSRRGKEHKPAGCSQQPWRRSAHNKEAGGGSWPAR